MQQSKQKDSGGAAEGSAKALPPAPSTSKTTAPPTTAGKSDSVPWNASKLSTNHLAASLTSTSAPIQTKTERALYDEEVLMFEAVVGFAFLSRRPRCFNADNTMPLTEREGLC